jgi:hypothetical protein
LAIQPPGAGQVGEVPDRAARVREQRLRILLEHRRDDHRRHAVLDVVETVQQVAGHQEVDAAGGKQRAVVHLRTARADLDLQAKARIGAVGQRLVEAAVRGLRLPVRGEHHAVGGERRGREAGQGQRRQPASQLRHGGPLGRRRARPRVSRPGARRLAATASCMRPASRPECEASSAQQRASPAASTPSSAASTAAPSASRRLTMKVSPAHCGASAAPPSSAARVRSASRAQPHAGSDLGGEAPGLA